MPERAGHVHEALCMIRGCFPKQLPSLPAPSPLALSPGAQKSAADPPSCWFRWLYSQAHHMNMCQCWGSWVQAGNPCLILMVCDLCALRHADLYLAPSTELTPGCRIRPSSRGTCTLGREEWQEGGMVFLSNC